jgi:hypothetical protein
MFRYPLPKATWARPPKMKIRISAEALDAYVALRRAEARCHCSNHSRTLCEACIGCDQHDFAPVIFDSGSGST